MESFLKVGDEVLWRGCFGTEPAKPARVTGLEITEYPRSKHGFEVDQVAWFMMRENRVLILLDNDHWAYAEQISPLN
jgi:hypothetical protein